MATKKTKAPATKTVLAELQKDVKDIKEYLDYLANAINKNAEATNDNIARTKEIDATLGATIEANSVSRTHANISLARLNTRVANVEDVVFAEVEPTLWQRTKDWFADRFPGFST